MRLRLLIVVIATVCLVSVGEPAAWAGDAPGGVGTGSGSLNAGGIGAVAGVRGRSGGFGGGSSQSGSNAEVDPVSYSSPPPNPPPSNHSEYTYVAVGQDSNTVCLNNGGATRYALSPTGVLETPAGTSPLGPVSAPTIYQLENQAGQAVGNPRDVCPALGGAGGKSAGAAPAVPPPPPPTPAEVWAKTPLPTLTVNFNPGELGLVHLDTWFWLTGVGGPITATSSIRGYRVVTTAHPTAAYWYFGDGDSAQGAVPGSQVNPSVTYTYAFKGTYTVKVIVGWSGQYTFSGHGDAVTVPLGTVDGPVDAAAYRVQEIRSVGVVPPSRD
jgi:PKD domain